MAERERLVKLVRDKVPEYLPDSRVEYRLIEDHNTVVAELRKKLLEEAAEYLLDPGLPELADVMAVLFALASVDLEVEEHELIDALAEKEATMGGMKLGLGMYVKTTEEPR